MVLHLIGLGLGSELDITLRGLSTVKNCDIVYLETYTSVLPVDLESLEGLYGKKVITAGRETIENEGDDIIGQAKDKDVAMLVVGDPTCATTHNDLMIR